MGMPDCCKTCKAQGNYNTWDKLAAKVGFTPPKTLRGQGGGNGAKQAVNAEGQAPTALGAKSLLDLIIEKEANTAKAEDQELSQEDVSEVLAMVHKLMQDAPILQPLEPTEALK